MNFTLPRLFRNPAISNFFPFPLGLRNSGVRLYYKFTVRAGKYFAGNFSRGKDCELNIPSEKCIRIIDLPIS